MAGKLTTGGKNIVLTDKESETLLQAIKFLRNPDTNTREIDILSNYLEANPGPAAVPGAILELATLDELAIRVELIRKIQRQHQETPTIKPDTLNNCQVSALLLMPVSSLRQLAADDYQQFERTSDAKHLLHFFMKGRLPANYDNPSKTAQSGEAGMPTLQKLNRSMPERQKCLKRDKNVCIITGMADPEVCHIIPFSINSTQKHTLVCFKLTAVLSHILGAENRAQLIQLIGRLGGSDKVWNLVCLNQQLRFWWGQGRIGLKPLGIEPATVLMSTISMQFHWMPVNDLDHTDATSITEPDIRKMLEFSNPRKISNTFAARGHSNREILTGHVFKITMPHEDIIKMELMMKIQWAMVRIAALSGAAGSQRLQDGPGESDDDGQIEAWLEEMLSASSH